jgi:predicted transcriptional regulator
MGTLVEYATQIAITHSKKEMSTDDLLKEIENVYSRLRGMETGESFSMVHAPAQQEKVEHEEQAHQFPSHTKEEVLGAIGQDEVKCLICGQGGMTVLKQHLTREHNMTPIAYKHAFGIPKATALVAVSYHEHRRAVALASGLGKSKSVAAAPPAAAATKVAKTSKVAPKATPVAAAPVVEHKKLVKVPVNKRTIADAPVVLKEAPAVQRFANTPHIIRRKASIPHNN